MTRRDVRFQTVEVETLNQDYVENRDFMVSRLSRSAFFCRDRESQSRHDQDKLRPPRLSILSFFSVKISRFVKIFVPEVPQKVSIMSRYLD